jgi:hypothetical protein
MQRPLFFCNSYFHFYSTLGEEATIPDPVPQKKGSQHGTKTANPIPPSQRHIEELLTMGFDKPEAIDALKRSNNDLERATRILLGDADDQLTKEVVV